MKGFSAFQQHPLTGVLHSQRAGNGRAGGTAGASSVDSDTYEDLLVSPTVLTLTRQRGNIDCGGLEYVLVRYGSFLHFVFPLVDGHLSVCIEPHADPLGLVYAVIEVD